jgi:hypothetical protein
MPREQPIYKDGSLIKFRSELFIDGKNVYIDDYNTFGESIPILGIVLMCVCTTSKSSFYDIMIDGEVIRTSEEEIELIQENYRSILSNDAVE